MPLMHLDDSPKFRKELAGVEENIKSLQTYVDRCTKASSKYCHAGHKFNDSLTSLANDVLAFGSNEKDPVMSQLSQTRTRGSMSTAVLSVHEASERWRACLARPPEPSPP